MPVAQGPQSACPGRRAPRTRCKCQSPAAHGSARHPEKRTAGEVSEWSGCQVATLLAERWAGPCRPHLNNVGDGTVEHANAAQADDVGGRGGGRVEAKVLWQSPGRKTWSGRTTIPGLVRNADATEAVVPGAGDHAAAAGAVLVDVVGGVPRHGVRVPAWEEEVMCARGGQRDVVRGGGTMWWW